MASPIDADWDSDTLSDGNLNATTHGSGTTATRTGLSSWPDDRPFFDTDEGIWYYNSHASAPSSITWTAMSIKGGEGVIFPTSPADKELFNHDNLGLCQYDSGQSEWLMINRGYFYGTVDDLTSDPGITTNDGSKTEYSAGSDWWNCDIDYDGSNDEADLDLTGAVLPENWMLEFKLIINSESFPGDTGSKKFYIGVSSADKSTAEDSNQDSIALYTNKANTWQLSWSDGAAMSTNLVDTARTLSAETMIVQIIKRGNLVRLNLLNTSRVLHVTKTATTTALENLRYMVIKHQVQSATGDIDADIDDISISYQTF